MDLSAAPLSEGEFSQEEGTVLLRHLRAATGVLARYRGTSTYVPSETRDFPAYALDGGSSGREWALPDRLQTLDALTVDGSPQTTPPDITHGGYALTFSADLTTPRRMTVQGEWGEGKASATRKAASSTATLAEGAQTFMWPVADVPAWVEVGAVLRWSNQALLVTAVDGRSVTVERDGGDSVSGGDIQLVEFEASVRQAVVTLARRLQWYATEVGEDMPTEKLTEGLDELLRA